MTPLLFHRLDPNEEAIIATGSSHISLNLHNPALVTVHDLPPLGWSVLRFQVTSKAAIPILEGITAENPIEIPEEVLDRPHVEFEPKNDGIFGR
ncbi:hypothetical protein NW759_015806 [Fusarium solani]|nr:hypothetical protein NW759_015806 [Fusarium solani]